MILPGVSADGFNTGFDPLDGILGAYFQLEEQKQGHELALATVQQDRLVSTVEVTEKINEQQQIQRNNQQSTKTLLYVGGAVLLGLVAIKVLKK